MTRITVGYVINITCNGVRPSGDQLWSSVCVYNTRCAKEPVRTVWDLLSNSCSLATASWYITYLEWQSSDCKKCSLINTSLIQVHTLNNNAQRLEMKYCNIFDKEKGRVTIYHVCNYLWFWCFAIFCCSWRYKTENWGWNGTPVRFVKLLTFIITDPHIIQFLQHCTCRRICLVWSFSVLFQDCFFMRQNIVKLLIDTPQQKIWICWFFYKYWTGNYWNAQVVYFQRYYIWKLLVWQRVLQVGKFKNVGSSTCYRDLSTLYFHCVAARKRDYYSSHWFCDCVTCRTFVQQAQQKNYEHIHVYGIVAWRLHP